MADPDEYESLPESTPLGVVAVAGAVAGVAEHCAMYPVDSVKTRMQSIMCEKQHRVGIWKMLVTMVKEEGMMRPLRGVNAMVAGAGPAHAMYFGCLETGKTFASRFQIDPRIGDGASAVAATCLHDAVMTPAEVVKQRMQMCCSPYNSSIDCTKTIYRNEGFRAFYRSYATALSMNIPYQMAMVVTYGIVQRQANPEKAYNPWVHFLAGGVAGGVASAVTMPLDVCKTLLNTQETAVLHALKKQEVRGFQGACSTIYGMAGFRGFFHGLTPRVLYQAPSTAISWSVYEFFKHYLNTDRNEGGSGSRQDPEDTYETLSVMKSVTATGQIGSRVGHLSPGATAQGSNEDHIPSVAVPITSRL